MKIKKWIVFAIILVATIIIIYPLYSYKHFDRNVINKLTSEQFRGRFAGDIGNEKAAAYIADTFRDIGIDYYSGDSFFQEFSVDTFDLEKQVATMKINFSDGSSYIGAYGKDFIEESKEKNINIVAKIIKDTTNVNIENNIVLLDNHETIHNLSKSPIGILLKEDVLSSNPSNKHTHSPVIKVSTNVYNMLKENSVEKIEIKLEFVKKSNNVKNVIGKIPGKSNKRAIVLSAHFDHVGWAGQQIYYGAIDNATGCAVLLDIAKGLSKEVKTTSLESDVIICAFNGEELGLSGSKAFIDTISNSYDEIYNINFDSIGIRGSKNILIEGDNEINKSLKDALSHYLTSAGIKHDIVSKGGLSDNITFEQNNYAAISICNEWSDVLHTKMDRQNLVDYQMLKNISKTLTRFIKENSKVTFKPDREIISPEILRKQMPMLREKYAKDINFDELKMVNYLGRKIVFSGSVKELSPEKIQDFYPSIKMTDEFKGYSLNSIKVSAEPIAIDNGIKIDHDILEEGRIYKRDLARNLISSINLYYVKDDNTLVISILRIHPQVKDSIHQPSEKDKLNYDQSFYKRTSQNADVIYKKIESNNQSFWVDITQYNRQETARNYSDDQTIYKLQEGFDYITFIKGIF